MIFRNESQLSICKSLRVQQLGSNEFELHKFNSDSKNSYLIFDESQNEYVSIKDVYRELYLLRQDDLM